MSKVIYSAINTEDIDAGLIGLFMTQEEALDACNHSVLSEAIADGYLIWETPLADLGLTADDLQVI